MCISFGVEPLLKLGFDFLPVVYKYGSDLELRTARELLNFMLALNQQAYSWTLYASGGFTARDFLPDDRA